MSDQHHAGCMSGAGHPDVRTPNLDRIARSGISFTRAYCNNPICGPSRSCFLSGQFVRTHGISGNFIREVRVDAPNLARLFRSKGYQTALIGKAHLPHQWVAEGFEHVRLSDLCDADAADPSTCHYFRDLIEAGLADQYDQGRLFEGHPGFGNRAFVSELPEGCSLESWTGRKALEFLDGRDRDKPFFLKVSFQRPHDPYAPPASRAEDYEAAALTLPANSCDSLERGFAGKPAFQREVVAGERGQGYPFLPRNAGELREQMAAHFALISMMDDQIGLILDRLEEENELRNTIIAYVADHGDFAGEHGLMLKNLGIYESIHRIPFLLAGPGVPQGRCCEGLVESVDLYPTLAHLAGLHPEEGVEGVSRVPEWSGIEPGGCQFTVCEWDFLGPQSRVHAVRDARYRLVFYDEAPDDGELYDHDSDPGELNNLFHDPAYRGVRTLLVGRLESFRRNARRVHGRADDIAQVAALQDQPTILIHQRGQKWSEVCMSITSSAVAPELCYD